MRQLLNLWRRQNQPQRRNPPQRWNPRQNRFLSLHRWRRLVLRKAKAQSAVSSTLCLAKTTRLVKIKRQLLRRQHPPLHRFLNPRQRRNPRQPLLRPQLLHQQLSLRLQQLSLRLHKKLAARSSVAQRLSLMSRRKPHYLDVSNAPMILCGVSKAMWSLRSLICHPTGTVMRQRAVFGWPCLLRRLIAAPS